MANNQNRNGDQQDQQGEGYQDPNEQESRDSRSDATSSEPLTSETGTRLRARAPMRKTWTSWTRIATTISVRAARTVASTSANSNATHDAALTQ